MTAGLEKIFTPDVLAALDERMRRIAQEAGRSSDGEWLDIPKAMELSSMTEHAVRQLINRLKAEGSEDVYQPNGPGTRPLLIRRSALRDLNSTAMMKRAPKEGVRK